MPSEAPHNYPPTDLWSRRYRGPEEYRARQAFELQAFGASSLAPQNERAIASSTVPQAPLPMHGVYTLPPDPNFLPASQTGRAWGRRGGNRHNDAVDVMASGTSNVGKHSTDRTFEISMDGSRQRVTAESRDIVRPLHRTAQRKKTARSEADMGPPGAVNDRTFSSVVYDMDSEEGGGNEEWEHVEDAVSPEDVLDANGEPVVDSDDDVEAENGRTGKRKAYASSDDPMAIFLALADTVLEETYYLEALPPNTCCRTCGEHGSRNTNVPANAPNPPIPPTQSSIPVVPIPNAGDSYHQPPLNRNSPSPPAQPLPSVISVADMPFSEHQPMPIDVDDRTPAEQIKDRLPIPEPLFRCTTCGVFVECRECCLERHALSPLHTILEWDYEGRFWRNTTLRVLGLSYQLGHDGYPCVLPLPLKTVTVLHVNGVHRVSAAFCGCSQSVMANPWQQAMRTGWYPASFAAPQTFSTFECLKYFRTMNVVANANVRDFVTVLEWLTDPLGVEWVPDRYKNFGLSTTQWNYMSRIRRAGIGHLAEGVGSATMGSAAVKCWACPRPGVNLPANFKDVEDNLRFKYNLFVGLDACFRLENKLRKKSSRKAYTILGDGLGCFAPWGGVNGYEAHIKKHVNEEDVSTCIAFAALMQKDTRFSKGLRATGIGGCICTRHEVVRPLGLVDLLKGERYSSMDYLFWASTYTEDLLKIMASYDVGCQWKIHLDERKAGMPTIFVPGSDGAPEIEVSLPVWHGGVHNDECAMCESLRYKSGAGMVDGEGVERVWSTTNPRAYATREMQMNNRHASLEDHFDNHNFLMNLRMGHLLPKRLQVAREEQMAQNDSHLSASATVEPAVLAEWTKRIKEWHAQEKVFLKNKTAENPYLSLWRKDEVTERKIKADLDREERDEEEKMGDDENARKMNVVVFVRLALQLQQVQLKIQAITKAKGKSGWGGAAKVKDMRTAFWKKYRRFRTLQGMFMPGVLVQSGDGISSSTSANPPTIESTTTNRIKRVVEPEDMVLWLPSDLPQASRKSYRASLFTTEAALRQLQCSENLNALRLRLHTKSHLIRFKNKNFTGQRKTTRARTLLDDLGDKINATKEKYRVAHTALANLVDDTSPFRPLADNDVQTKFVFDHDGQAARRLAKLTQHSSRRRIQSTLVRVDDTEQEGVDDGTVDGAWVTGSSRQKMSWIWTAQGAPDVEDQQFLHDSVRVEWSKSFARKERWKEEVILLEEEMRRVLESLSHEAKEWESRERLTLMSKQTGEGMRTYARRQVAVWQRLLERFTNLFSTTSTVTGKRKKRGKDD